MKPENVQYLTKILPDFELQKSQCYLGNIGLKRSGVKFAMTPDHIREWHRCKDDIHYFCKKYVKIIHLDRGLVAFDTYEFQEEILEKVPQNRYSIIITARQAGKTTVAAAIILHYILFNKEKQAAVIANKGSTAREILDRIQNSYQNLPKWIQQGITEWNKGSTVLENGCKVFTGSTSASSIRGKSINFLFIDEVAFIDTNLYEDFFNSVYPTISSGQTTQICMVSTPKGMNHFYHEVKKARANPTKYLVLEYDWRAVPWRDEAWAKDEAMRIGQERFNQEYGCQFIGSESTLVSMAALQTLKLSEPIQTSKSGDLRIYEAPDKKRTYFATVDVSEGVKADHSTVSIIDVTELPYRQVAVYRSNIVSPLLLPGVVVNLAKKYNEAYVLIEINSIGYSVASDVIYDMEYENVLYIKTDEEKSSRMGIRTTSKTKKLGCLRLKDMIESGILTTSDEWTIQELYTFVEKGKSYEADALTDHDDIVMGLVNFSYYSILPEFEEITSSLFKQKFRKMREKEMDEDSIGSAFFAFDGSAEEVYDVERGFSDSVLTYRGDSDTAHFFL